MQCIVVAKDEADFVAIKGEIFDEDERKYFASIKNKKNRVLLLPTASEMKRFCEYTGEMRFLT
jgi:hypothetical protein